MIKLKFDISKVSKRFERVHKNFKPAKKKFLRDTWTVLKREIVRNTPKDTWLAKSKWKKKTKKDSTVISNFAQNNWDYYLSYVNNWTSKQRAQKFVEKTLDRFSKSKEYKNLKMKFFKNILK